MIAGGGTSRLGKKHYYYVYKQKNKALCDKKREDKDKLELCVTQVVHEFLSDRKNVKKAAQDTINYYEQRTGDNGMRSIEAQIRHAQDEAERITIAFILARNDLLRANIERKMQEIEILIKDLTAHKAQIELERGQKITKEKIIDFVSMLIKGDPNDKEYQKKLIDNLVYKVFVYDDTVVTYLIFGNDKEIKEISLADNDKAITGLTQRVQPLSLLVPEARLEPARYFYRGIFKAYASKIALNKKPLKQGIFSRKPPKNAPKSMFFLYFHNLSVCYKFPKISNFPKLPKFFHKNEPLLMAHFAFLTTINSCQNH